MKKIWIGALVAAPLAFAAGQATAPANKKVHAQTEKNLEAAMKGEAFAAAKYQLFAEHARASGHPEIAKLFEDAAKTERQEHFVEEEKLSELVGTDAENLQNAIKGEEYEHSSMYPEFAKQAEARGDKEVADRFREIAKDEGKHRDAFKAALEGLQPSGARKSPNER